MCDINHTDSEGIAGSERTDNTERNETPPVEATTPAYDLKSDFLVILPNGILRIPQSSNLSWLPLFYGLPKEVVEKRPAYLNIPRNIRRLLEDEKYGAMIEEEQFLEMIWDGYAWAVWQGLKVPNDKGEYVDIPGDWQDYSGNFPIWRLSYLITNYFRKELNDLHMWNLQDLFMMDIDDEFPWLSLKQFGNLVLNLMDQVVEKYHFQPTIDETWKHRQPEDYMGFNLRRAEFLRAWNHSRNHPHESVEQRAEDGLELPDMSTPMEQQVDSAEMVEEFKTTLSLTPTNRFC